MAYYEYPDGTCKYVDPEDEEEAPDEEPLDDDKIFDDEDEDGVH